MNGDDLDRVVSITTLILVLETLGIQTSAIPSHYLKQYQHIVSYIYIYSIIFILHAPQPALETSIGK